MKSRKPRFVFRPHIAFLATASLLALASPASAQVRGQTAQSINGSRNTNVNRDINVDVDNNWDNHNHHPVAAGVAIGTAAAVTSAAIGSRTQLLPSGCLLKTYGTAVYYNCSDTWYEPQYAGTSVTYIVVEAPH